MPVTQTKILKADLCPRKPSPKVLDVGDTSVTVEVCVESKKKLVSSKFNRCVGAAQETIDRCQDIIQLALLSGRRAP